MNLVQATMQIRIARAVCSVFSLALLLVSPAAAQFSPNRKPKPTAAPSNRYALILSSPSVVDRFPARTGYQSAAARAYRAQIETEQEQLKSRLRAGSFQVIGSVSVLSNDVYVIATPDRVDELKVMPGVAGVVAMRQLRPLVNRATTLMNVPAAWTTLGGVGNAGAGMKVAIIDSGIDQTHPAFQDSTLAMPSGYPLCTAGHSEDCAYTNNKVIVARSYVRQVAAGPAATSIPDDYSPRDRLGHGTAIGSVVAGNTNSTGAVTFNGVAPKAYLGNYKIYNSPGLSFSDASFEDVAVAALNDAFADGFDIANFSSGLLGVYAPLETGSACGQTSGTPCDYIAFNFEKAAKNGMVIAVAAGNDGYSSVAQNLPTVGLMSSPATAPSVIAVGGTMNSHVFYPGVSVPGGGAALAHIAAETSDAWYFGPNGAASAPLVDAGQKGDPYGCSAYPAYSMNGAFALIERGPATGACAFNVKATNAVNAGAIGIIFYDYNTGPVTVVNPITTADSSGNVPLYGPVVMVSNSDGLALKTYADGHAGASVVIDPNGTEQDISAYNDFTGFPDATNQLVAYSSPGPNPGSLSSTAANGAFTVKPDIVATAGADPTFIDANQTIYCCNGMYFATQSFDPLGDMYSVNGYLAAEGTSFASPLVAGSAALVWQQHPKWTAAQVRSALVNYAAQDTTSDDFGDNVGIANVGAGRLNTGAAVAANVTVSPVSVGFGALGTSLPAAQALQITNSGTGSVTLAATVSAPMSSIGTAAAGVTVKLDNASLTIAAGATATLNVSLSGAVPAAGQYSGTISLAATGISITVPYLFIVPSTTVYDMFPIVGGQNAAFGACFESTPNGDAGPLGIKLVDLSGAPIVGTPVRFTLSPRTSATLKSVTGEPACTSTTNGTYTCNTDNYGVAWAEVFGSPNVGVTSSITATAGGLTSYFGAQIGCGASVIPVPAITSISDSAAGITSVAPGSYISIYGTGLVNSEFVAGTVGDSATYIPLPLTLDGINVSFDVPGAYDGTPLHYNGSPGYLTFVAASAGQINLQIPWELQGATSAQVKVTVDGYAYSNVFTLPLATYAPALFSNTGTAAAIDATTGLVVWPTALSGYGPAHAGDTVELYANGLGPVSNQPASGAGAPSGPFAQTKATPTVTIGGKQAAVSFSGLAPGYPGLYQINITVPSGLSAGNQPLILTIGGATAPTVQLPIQ